MSLKIVTALVMAGLVDKLSAFNLKALPDGPLYPIHGFSYTSDKNADHDKLSISCDAGSLSYFQRFKNVSAWSLLVGDDSSTITQEMLFTSLSAHYYPCQIGVDNGTKEGFVCAYFRRCPFNFSLTANGSDSQCHLAVKIERKEARPWVYVSPPGGEVFNTPAVVEDLRTFLSELLADLWPTTFTDVVAADLHFLLNVDTLCRQLLVATPEHFPEPHFPRGRVVGTF